MTGNRLSSCALMILAMLMPLTSHADLYTADAAHEKKDYERAFALYRELAELGRPEAQESLAAMYINGEGVERDNALGYAWASLALENGYGDAAREIIRQVEPLLNDAERVQIVGVREKFGQAALEKRLLPNTEVFDTTEEAKRCKVRYLYSTKAVYPDDAMRQRLSGTVLVEAIVAPDGRARNVHAWYSVPTTVFEEAGERVAFASSYRTPTENGVAIACTIRFNVDFKIDDNRISAASAGEQKKVLAEIRANAEAGDPRSQVTYPLLLEMRPDLKRNPEPAINWMLRAAQAGVPSAQYLVGVQALSSSEESNRSKGLLWLQIAADVDHADAQTSLANYLLRTSGDLDKAQNLLEKAAASGHTEGRFQLAALLAAATEPARRDSRRALDLLEQVKPYVDFNPIYFEVRAAAKAMLGDFAGAQEEQKKALQKARKLDWDLTELQARLSNYAESKPWVGNLFPY